MAVTIHDYHTDWQQETSGGRQEETTASDVDTLSEVYDFLKGQKTDKDLNEVIDDRIDAKGVGQAAREMTEADVQEIKDLIK